MDKPGDDKHGDGRNTGTTKYGRENTGTDGTFTNFSFGSGVKKTVYVPSVPRGVMECRGSLRRHAAE